MRLSRWALVIAGLVGFGCLQVAQRNAIVLKGYAVGARTRVLHQHETDLAWLNARVIGLASPMHLDRLAQERQLQFIARATLAPAAPSDRPTMARVARMPAASPAPRVADADAKE